MRALWTSCARSTRARSRPVTTPSAVARFSAALEARGLALVQFAAGHALLDARLLVRLALVDARRARGLRERGGRGEREGGGGDQSGQHVGVPLSLTSSGSARSGAAGLETQCTGAPAGTPSPGGNGCNRR